MTTGAILTAIAAELGDVAVPSSNVTTTMHATTRARLLNAVNRRYRALLSSPSAIHLREGTTSFPSVAGTALYAISGVAKLHRIFEVTNDRRLLAMTLDQYRDLDPDPASNEGTPTHFVFAGYNSSRQPQVYLWPTPSSAITYTCDVLNALTDLSLDADLPLLPDDFHDVLVLAGLEEEYRRKDDERAAYVRQERLQRERDLIYWLAETASGSSELMDEPTTLGAWTPAGS